ncbi:helix-turn-helix transcriptional regulator [Clostridium sp.]|uniref:helix-turn-helix domain-containing protein n=1 Tax=Clostridium sp. TaxID=1506 RepID=UPI0029101DE2|nr:helix-turn-helix transcriptional regulator [Clostridium sp.]MDU3410035.1 helix-turn-helix transcriptional regulator [Clostridium sp.]
MIHFDIKNIRRLKGITQEELAFKTGLSQSYISELEAKDSIANPTLQTIEIIANALGVCPLDLLHCDCKNHKD